MARKLIDALLREGDLLAMGVTRDEVEAGEVEVNFVTLREAGEHTASPSTAKLLRVAVPVSALQEHGITTAELNLGLAKLVFEELDDDAKPAELTDSMKSTVVTGAVLDMVATAMGKELHAIRARISALEGRGETQP